MAIDNRPRNGIYPTKPMPTQRPPRGYADARNEEFRGVNMIAPPEPWQHPSVNAQIEQRMQQRQRQLRDAQIDNMEGESESYRQRIEHALAETRRIFEARDKAL